MTDRRKSNNDNKKKLTKVISTKLSIEDDNLLQQFADFVYKAGIIRAPAKSKMLRVMVTHVLSDFKEKTKIPSPLQSQRIEYNFVSST
jgi:hypothetical protein